MDQTNQTASFSSGNLLFGAFGFVTTNIGSNPSTTTCFGLGGLTGSDGASDGSVAKSGPSFVASITKTANTGEFLVTLAAGYTAVWFAAASLWGPVAGPSDGIRADVCVPANQGSGRTTATTFLVTTNNANTGAPVETASRTCTVFLVIKKSKGAGA